MSWLLGEHITSSWEPCQPASSSQLAGLRTCLARVLLLEACECRHLLLCLLAAAVSQVLQEAACSLRSACSSTHTASNLA
jgi:hypothetical protein